MTDGDTPNDPYAPAPRSDADKPPSSLKPWLWVAAFVGVMIIGFALAANSGDDSPSAAPRPTSTPDFALLSWDRVRSTLQTPAFDDLDELDALELANNLCLAAFNAEGSIDTWSTAVVVAMETTETGWLADTYGDPFYADLGTITSWQCQNAFKELR